MGDVEKLQKKIAADQKKGKKSQQQQKKGKKRQQQTKGKKELTKEKAEEIIRENEKRILNKELLEAKRKEKAAEIWERKKIERNEIIEKEYKGNTFQEKYEKYIKEKSRLRKEAEDAEAAKREAEKKEKIVKLREEWEVKREQMKKERERVEEKTAAEKKSWEDIEEDIKSQYGGEYDFFDKFIKKIDEDKNKEKLLDKKFVILEDELPIYKRPLYVQVPVKAISEAPKGIKFVSGEKVFFEDSKGNGNILGVIKELQNTHARILKLHNFKYYKIPYSKIKKLPSPPKKYKGGIFAGDKIDFYDKQKRVTGIVIGYRQGNYVVQNLTRNKEEYILRFDDDTIRTDKKKDIIPSYSEFLSTETDPFFRIFMRRKLANIIMDAFPEFFVSENISLKDYGLRDDESYILKNKFLRFSDNDLECNFIETQKNNVLKGFWNCKVTYKGYSIEEKIFVPKSHDERMYNPLVSDKSYFDKCFEDWVITRFINGDIQDQDISNYISQKIEDARKRFSSDYEEIIDILIDYTKSEITLYEMYPSTILQIIQENNFISKLPKEQLLSWMEQKRKYGDARLYNEKDIDKRMEVMKKFSSIPYFEKLIALLSMEMDRLKLTNYTGRELMVRLSEIIESYIMDMQAGNGGSPNGVQLATEVIKENIKRYYDFKQIFINSELSQVIAEYDKYFQTYYNAYKKFNLIRDKLKNRNPDLVEKEKKVSEYYLGSAKGNILNIFKNFSEVLSKNAYDILEDINTYENYVWDTMGEQKSVKEYASSVLFPFLFLRGKLLNHTKSLQSKIKSGIIKLSEMPKDMAILFPEFMMNADPSDKRRGKSYIEDIELPYFMKNVIESYMKIIYPFYYESYTEKIDYNWDKYRDVASKCSESMKISIKDFSDKDTVIWYDSKTKKFKCYNINDVVEDIRDFEEQGMDINDMDASLSFNDKNKEAYDLLFLQKIKRSYISSIPEKEEYPELISIYKPQPQKEYEFTFVYSRESVLYDYFVNTIEDLKLKYSMVKFNILKATDVVRSISSHNKNKKFPYAILKSKKDILFYTQDIRSISDKIRDLIEGGKKIYDQMIVAPSVKSSSIYQEYDIKTPANVISADIKSGNIDFPFVHYYVNPEKFVNVRQKDLKARINVTKGPQKLAELVFADSDYENIDILTDYFTENARVRAIFTKDGNKKSLLELWKEQADIIAKNAISYSKTHKTNVNAKSLKEGIYMSKIPQCTNFKISYAIAFYNYYKPKVVLDPFAGWGDRALGSAFSDTVQTYYGIDPNSNLRKGYDDIKKFVEENFNNKKINFYSTKIEDFDLSVIKEEVDMVFSSPPYFDYEVYTQEDTQSIKTHETQEKWLKWLLDQTLRVVEKLKNKGYLIYYLGSCREFNIPSRLTEELKYSKLLSQVRKIQTKNMNKHHRPLTFYVWQKL